MYICFQVLNNTRELKQKLKELISYNSDTFRNGNLGTDKVCWLNSTLDANFPINIYTCILKWYIFQVKLGTPGYKERYYDQKLSTKNQEEREIKRKQLVYITYTRSIYIYNIIDCDYY